MIFLTKNEVLELRKLLCFNKLIHDDPMLKTVVQKVDSVDLGFNIYDTQNEEVPLDLEPDDTKIILDLISMFSPIVENDVYMRIYRKIRKEMLRSGCT